ncbi:MAG: hypothetical protein P8X70_03175, partial [Nanoarchaeota archaeon]
MEKNELLKFCSEKNVLLDNFLLDIFLNYDFEVVKNLIEKIKIVFDKKFINKKLIEDNKLKIKKFIEEISILKNIDLNGLMNNFGIEKIEVKDEVIIDNKGNFDAKIKVVSSFPCVG